MKKIAVIGILVSFMLTSCFSPWKGEEGNLIISLVGDSGRSILDEYFPPNDPEILERLIYNITLSSDGITMSPFNAKGGETINTTVAVGLWEVKVDAYIIKTGTEEMKQEFPGYNVGDSIPFAEGKNSVEVKAGHNSVGIPMDQFFFTVTFETNGGTKFAPVKVLPGDYPEGVIVEPTKTGYDCLFNGWYSDQNLKERYNWEPITDNITLYAKWVPYEIGNYGPGDGIIFYVNPEGFTLQDIDESKNKTCHYLEATLEDFTYTSINTGIRWGENTKNVAGTGERLGYGKYNTNLILASLEEGTTETAAQLCLCLGDDWFLPSKDEFQLLWNNREFVSGLEGVEYWSSSQCENYSAWTFFSGNSLFMEVGKEYGACVRAIRAF
jgi:uncharacterized repeat protein (TIGR02543 family)